MKALDLLISSGQVFSRDPGMVVSTAPSPDASPMSSPSTMFPLQHLPGILPLRTFLPSSFRVSIASSSFFLISGFHLRHQLPFSDVYLCTGPYVSRLPFPGVYSRTGSLFLLVPSTSGFRRLPAYRTPSLPASYRVPNALSSDIFVPYRTSCLPASTSVTGFLFSTPFHGLRSFSFQ